MNQYSWLLVYITFSSPLLGQSISGSLVQLANQEIRLESFDGLKTYMVSQTTIDQQGNFTLSYARNDYGVGFLMSTDNQPLFVLLTGEDIELHGESLGQKETLTVSKGEENKAFVAYATAQPKREQALSAWSYLQNLYATDPVFQNQSTPQAHIVAEMQRIKKEDEAFINALPEESYVRWYLPMRKLVSSVPIVAQQRTEEIPSVIQAFRRINYADPRLYKSGLFRDVLESQFWLLENSGKDIEGVFEEMSLSIDALLASLIQDEKIFNEATNYLFDLLERHSLFKASEHLAISVLNETACTVNTDLARQLETYRAMKLGNQAKDISLTGLSYYQGKAQNRVNKLSGFETPYTLVVFGASWCPKCNEEIPKIAQQYEKWRSQGLEVLYVSLETDPSTVERISKEYPFITYCDFQKWDGPVVEDYYVFATPTLFLLDSEQTIILRPNSVAQMDAWVDWFLVQGNKVEE
ncbi:TlpA family protein disulfide reductase [Mongoliitalea lutea]|uniref:Thioredoxin domain-containing protein n=1 Tax=Mongoliitalea lutea TaxID=849756 RepID=A0A8J3CV28_9BACT|nr:TlpA disulfide reductase family protein [Mongoliitalea lutea]GHB29449.1 hypothetical protein GCM10008106_07990 [Mongoliitalea lutea]